MEQKQPPIQANGMMHGVITAKVEQQARGQTHRNFLARLDDGKQLVLMYSENPGPTSSFLRDPYGFRSSRPAEEPLATGSHIMANPDPRFLYTDTRIKYPIARMWRRAKSEEIPAASATDTVFKAHTPLPEPNLEAVPAVVQTALFSKDSVLAHTIERKVREAVSAGGVMFILYDPAAGPDYPFICLGREYDALRAASLRLRELGSFGTRIFTNGPNGCGYIDEMSYGFDRIMQTATDKTDMTFIPIDGLARQSGPKAEIEVSVLNFCLYSAQFNI